MAKMAYLLLLEPSHSETSVSGAPVTRNSDCNLHRQHAATSSTEPGVAKTVCAGGSLSGKSGLPGQDGEMLSCSIPAYCLSRGPVGPDNNGTFSPSAKAKPYFGGLSTPSRTELSPNKDSLHSDWTYEPCLSNRDHACPSSPQSSPAPSPTSSDSVWPWEQSDNPLDPSSPGGLGVVGLREPTPEWHPPIDATIWTNASKKGWGAVYQGISTGSELSVAEATVHINVLELRGATLAFKALL